MLNLLLRSQRNEIGSYIEFDIRLNSNDYVCGDLYLLLFCVLKLSESMDHLFIHCILFEEVAFPMCVFQSFSCLQTSSFSFLPLALLLSPLHWFLPFLAGLPSLFLSLPLPTSSHSNPIQSTQFHSYPTVSLCTVIFLSLPFPFQFPSFFNFHSFSFIPPLLPRISLLRHHLTVRFRKIFGISTDHSRNYTGLFVNAYNFFFE